MIAKCLFVFSNQAKTIKFCVIFDLLGKLENA